MYIPAFLKDLRSLFLKQFIYKMKHDDLEMLHELKPNSNCEDHILSMDEQVIQKKEEMEERIKELEIAKMVNELALNEHSRVDCCDKEI